MTGKCICGIVLVGILSVGAVSAQEPAQTNVRLRFDEARAEEIADDPVAALPAEADTTSRFAYKLNRRRTSFEKAYDAVTLWNVRRVKVRNRRMRLSDSTRRERVKLLKFFIERDSRKGARPHLSGNVAGYTWSGVRYDSVNRSWRRVAEHIERYTLRHEYDSVRKAAGKTPLGRVPDELWHSLEPETVYILDGQRIPGPIFYFIDGLILQRLEISAEAEAEIAPDVRTKIVLGRVYPGRVPLVIVDGRISTLEAWLKLCSSGAFSMNAAVPMRYYYLQPVEAVQLYGERGRFGAVCIELVD